MRRSSGLARLDLGWIGKEKETDDLLLSGICHLLMGCLDTAHCRRTEPAWGVLPIVARTGKGPQVETELASS